MLQTSGLLQSFLSRMPVANLSPIEFIPGQIFRGTVQKLFPDNLAMVQIGGLQVMAKLEASLEAGQKAWLQVQPSASVVTLKVLTDTEQSQQVQKPTLEGLMKSLGIPDSKEAKELVQALVKENAPITRSIVTAYESIVKGAGSSPDTLAAFMTALKRGLPLTRDTVGALQAFLSTQTLGSSLQHLSQQLERFLAEPNPSSASGGDRQAASGQAKVTTTDPQFAMARQIGQQLQEKLLGLQEQIGAFQKPSGSSAAQTNQTPAQPPPQATPSFSFLQESGGRQTGESSAGNGVRLQPNLPEAALQADADDFRLTPARISAQLQDPLASRSVTGPEAGRPSLSDGQAAVTGSAENGMDHLQQGPVKGELVKELFRQLGLSHERELMQQVMSPSGTDSGSAKLESVKSLLLQLTQSASSIPAGLRDAADHLLQQITGQQLMLLQPINQAVGQIIMQVPLRMEQGEETAFIQIEAKKKDGGQIDSDNCRLFFNLDLAQLGITMVDVAIVNRIVSIQIFNDMPWLEPLVAEGRVSIANELREWGYQLSSVRSLPIPAEPKQTGTPASASAFKSEYKGMDIRV